MFKHTFYFKSAKEMLSHLYSPEVFEIDLPYLDMIKKTSGDRIIVSNCNGGYGDTILIPIVLKLYKKYHPDDYTILYDSLCFDYYYEKPDYINEIIKAGEHPYNHGIPEKILQMDPKPPFQEGKKLSEIPYDYIISTHHAYGRGFNEKSIKMDWHTVITDSILQGTMPLQLMLKKSHKDNVDDIIKKIKSGNRITIGIQNRGNTMYESMQLSQEEYLVRLEELAETLVRKYNAKIILCGDLKLRSNFRYSNGDWIDLDSVTNNVFYKIDILRQLDYFFAAPSGFSIIVNYLRTPYQSPSILLYCNERMIYNEFYSERISNYVLNKGGMDNNLIVFTHQHPDLLEFLFDIPHTTDKIISFLEKIMLEFQFTPKKSKWLVPFNYI